MLEIVNQIDKIMDELQVIRFDLEEDLNEIEDKKDLIISLREKNFSIDDISKITNLSIRNIVDILGLL